MFRWGTKQAMHLLAPQRRDDFENQSGPIKIRLSHPESKRPPILFVPGSFSGAWIWQGNFLEYFHQAGYDVAAMSFAGHGQHGWPLRRRGLSAFDRDIEMAIEQFETPPILIAHSLGGLIAQRAAYRVPVTALALLSPIPLHGVAASVLSLAKKSPMSILKLAAVTFEPRLARLGEPPLGIYSPQVGRKVRTFITERLQAESPIALMQSLLPNSNATQPAPCPIHFWGAEGDHIIPAHEVRRAAQAMGAASKIFPGMSHTIQAEPNWRIVANHVLNWVEKQGQ